jgi:DNA repair protein RecN (Recombination protein N)
VTVGDDDPGDDVAFLLAANPGAPLLPMAKVASGGELARAMLALRLVLLNKRDDSGPPTLVFDEVDAGIGGQAATAVGSALAALATQRQVLVVTHLPQVAAFADTQIAVTKHDDGTTTTATAIALTDNDRVIEISRMLSGSPDSSTAQEHAAELLAAAQQRHPPSG